MALYEQWDTVLINNKLESSNTTTDQTEKRLQMIKRVNHWLSQQSAYIDENFTNNTFIYYCLNSWILERKTYGPNEKSSIIRAFLYMYDMYTIVTERQIDPLRYRKVQAFVDNYNNGHKDLDKEFIEILWTRINDCNELIQNSPSFDNDTNFIVHCTCTTHQQKSIKHVMKNHKHRFDQFLIGKLENTHELLMTFNSHYLNGIIFVKITNKTKFMYLSKLNPENSSTEIIFCAGSVFRKLGQYYYEFEGIDEKYIKNKEMFIKNVG
jgi:hypothetical protein